MLIAAERKTLLTASIVRPRAVEAEVKIEVKAQALSATPVVTKYYYHGGQRVALRQNGVL